jgi:4-amino-4-deoxy-L-arabinose transferase-like glycosyltransferase
LPAWNEQETIRQAILEAETALCGVCTVYEIIVVDDGSTDGTADIVETLAATKQHVRLLRHSKRQGYGKALRTGFEAATLDLVACTDADLQFDLTDLEHLLPLTRRYDIVSGFRSERQDSAVRRLLGWGYGQLVTVLLGGAARDVDCALKIFRRDQLRELLPESDGFFAPAEMLARARLQGRSVGWASVHHRPRPAGQSKGTLRDLPRTLAALVRFWWNRSLFPVASAPAPGLGGWFWTGLVFLICLAGPLLLLNLNYPLLEQDEGRYAEIGREMLLSGDWIVPTLNHEPYYDKPPLFYWLLAGSFSLLGTNAAAARLVPALAALLTILATYLFGRRMVGQRAALLGALALTLMTGFVQCGRILILDSVLSLFVALAFFTAREAVEGARLRWAWWLVSGLCSGLGVLTKGPVALVLLGPPLVAYVWLQRDKARLGLVSWLMYGGVIVAVAAPWFLAICVRQPEFAEQFFIDHHLRRFLGEEGFHESPLWYYVPVVLIGALPWSLLLVPFAQFLLSRSPAVGQLRPGGMGFLLLWAGWGFLFFSLSRGKLPPYMLPMASAGALLIGCYLDRALATSLARFFRLALNAVPQNGVAMLAVIWLAACAIVYRMQLISMPEMILGVVLGTACLVVVALWGRLLSPQVAWTFFCALGLVVTVASAHQIVPAWANRRAPIQEATEATALLQDGSIPVICCGREWGSIPFYVQHNNVYNVSGASREEVREFLRAHPRHLLLARHDEMYEAFASIPRGMTIVRVMDAGVARVALVEAK